MTIKEPKKRDVESSIIAINYDLDFHIDVSGKDEIFKVYEKINLDVKNPTKSCVLNGKNLIVKNAKINVNGKEIDIPNDKITYDKSKETITFNFPNELQSGNIILKLEVVGKYGDVSGLYLSKYTGKDGDVAHMATTQFEAADARRAFVCDDNPSSKASFDISMTIDEKLQAISNMPENKTSIKNGKKTVKFLTTPKMSTYLVYLGVGDFEYMETLVGKVKLRVITTPGKISQAKYALEAGKKLLESKQEYYGIPYALPKLDMIAVPDFSAGAMENWGAITYREDILLCDENKSSASQKLRTVTVISHELEHMWFGNLVTMKWWDDLWLNESFADVRSYYGVEKTYPKLEPWADFLAMRVSGAYTIDGLTNSHPIHVPVNSPGEIREVFDAISYSKGGMVLRMVENMLGGETYRKGLHTYLKKYAYKNAQANDLWKTLEEVSGKPVGDIVDVWINKMGFPLVEAEVNGSKLNLKQKNFKYLKSNDNTLWKIPLSIKTNNGLINEIFEQENKILTLKENDWIKINSGEFGFYRVKYSDVMLKNLGKVILNKKLDNIDRWGVHNDLAAMCFCGKVELSKYIDFVLKTYENEEDYLVLMDIFGTLNKIRILSGDAEYFKEMKKTIQAWLNLLLERIGWDAKKGEKETQETIRSAVINMLGKLDDDIVLKKAKELAEKEMDRAGSIDSAIRGVIYKLAAYQGDEVTFEKLKDVYRKARDVKQRNDILEAREILEAMGNFKKIDLLEKVLSFGLSKDVKQSDFVFLVGNISSNVYGKKYIWKWVKENWSEVKKYYSGGLILHFNRILLGMTSIADKDVGKEIQSFMGKNSINGSERSVKQMVELMEINSNFLERANKNIK